MRTTLNIDEDVLLAAKGIAAQRGVSMGKVLSDLVRQALNRNVDLATRNGVPLFPCQPDAGIVTMELINRLRDEIP